MEMLPALAVFPFVAMDWLQQRWKDSRPLWVRLAQPVALLLIALNTVAMMYAVPLV
jgi:hypothetical protein